MMQGKLRNLPRCAVFALAAIVAAVPVAAQTMKTPMVYKHVYPDAASAKPDLAAALKQAKLEHKRIILDFGGDWCGDCQVLDIYLRQSPNAELVAKHFIVVHINVGHFDQNTGLAKTYGIPLNKGVPALAVLDERGKLLYSQKTGEFEDMRDMSVKSVTEFLNRWKA